MTQWGNTHLYIAGAWAAQGTIASLALDLARELDFVVVSTWHLQALKCDEVASQSERFKLADRDLGQLDLADVVLFVNFAEHYHNDRTCGRHVELGYAIAGRRRTGRPTILHYGDTRSVFHAYAN